MQIQDLITFLTIKLEDGLQCMEVQIHIWPLQSSDQISQSAIGIGK